MANEIKLSFYVTVTFDVTVGDDTAIYKEISEILEQNGLLKTYNESDLPENVYFGERTAKVDYEGEYPTDLEIKGRAKIISKRYYDLVEKYFKSKNAKYRIFVEVGKKSTTTFRYTK